MADEPLAAGAVSLEEPAVVGPISQPAEPPPADDPPDGTIEGSGGVKFVPIPALIAERTQRKETATKLAAVEAENATLKDKAGKFDELKGYVDQARPIIDAVRARPDLIEQARQPKPAPAVAPVLSADEAVEYAKDLDLYKPDGTPDTERAQRLAARNQQIADRQAKVAVAPFAALSAQQQSQATYAYYANLKDAQGRTVDPKAITEIWRTVPPELSANPAVANVLYYAAKGLSEHTGKAPAQAPTPVVETDALGGGGDRPKGPSVVEQNFAKAAGVSTTEFSKTAAKFQPGRINSLE